VKTAISFVAALALLLATRVAGQVTAHQGQQDPHEFHSSMVVEVPLKDITQLAPGQGFALTNDLAQYTCDDTSINGMLTVEAKKPGKTETGKAVFEFTDTVHVRKSHDRLVDITFALKHGDLVLGKGSAPTMDIEEKDTRPFRVRFLADKAALRQAFATDPRPTLEITLVVRDNN
jgi:hypothetical protein